MSGATAFQANAFQINAFQISVTVSGTHSSGLGSGGGGPWAGGGRRRRRVDLDNIFEVIDEAQKYTEKQKREAYARIDKTITDLVNGVKEEAQELGASKPAAVIKTAGALSKQISEAIVGRSPAQSRFDVSVFEQSLRRFEAQIKAVQARFDLQERKRAAVERKAEAERIASIERELARLKALEEDDEDVLMLLM